jgi:GNAT superfamily N-acetyltransferase
MRPNLAARWHSSQEIIKLREAYGHATGFWATGRVSVESSRWIAASGAPTALFNQALCHGDGGGRLLERTVQEINAAGFPTILNVAGAALRDVSKLVELGYTCVGALPLMVRSIDDVATDSAVRRLGAVDLPQARQFVEDVFHVPPELAMFGMPDTTTDAPGQAVWGLFEDGVMVSAMGTSVVGSSAVVWSMATPERHRRRGYAARLLAGALACVRDDGATHCLLQSSDLGAPFYEAMGFEVVEWWQAWSRPRWVLGRG